MGESPLGSHIEFRLMNVDADDRVRAHHAGGLGDIQTNSTDTKDHQTLSDGEMCIVIHHTDSSGDSAAEKGGSPKVEFRRNHSESVF